MEAVLLKKVFYLRCCRRTTYVEKKSYSHESGGAVVNLGVLLKYVCPEGILRCSGF